MSGIRWSFTTALVPWQGGFYERLVGMVKRHLRKVTWRKYFTSEQLVTLLTEIEAVLNSRPLTYVYEDLRSGFVLTPSHFLVSNRKLGLSTTDNVDYPKDEDFQPNSKDSATKLLESWKKGQQHLDSFWKFWKEEYLMSLRERLPLMHKMYKNCDLREPKEGEIVIIKDDVPRSSWKLGKIMRLIPSRDYKIPSAEIQLPSKSIVKRAVNYLYPLELQVQGQVSKKSNKGLTRCHNDDLTKSDEQNGVKFTENGVTSKCERHLWKLKGPYITV